MRATERTARKRHQCTFCLGPIVPGQRYIDGFWLFEGEPSPWQAHTDCQALANQFPDPYEGVPPFDQWEPDYDLADDPEGLAEYNRLLARAQEEPTP